MTANKITPIRQATGLRIKRRFYLGDQIPLHIRAGEYAGVASYEQRRTAFSASVFLCHKTDDAEGDSYFLTNETGEGAVRKREKCEVEYEDYCRLYSKARGFRIRKTRYALLEGSGSWVFDHYSEPSSSAFVEIRFSSEEEARAFKIPSWLQEYEEVTGDPAFEPENMFWRSATQACKN